MNTNSEEFWEPQVLGLRADHSVVNCISYSSSSTGWAAAAGSVPVCVCVCVFKHTHTRTQVDVQNLQSIDSTFSVSLPGIDFISSLSNPLFSPTGFLTAITNDLKFKECEFTDVSPLTCRVIFITSVADKLLKAAEIPMSREATVRGPQQGFVTHSGKSIWTWGTEMWGGRGRSRGVWVVFLTLWFFFFF